jgi:NADPH2:quinone reductase
MKIIQVFRTGGPDVLTCVDVPQPMPKPNEVLIRSHSIGVGIPDLAIRAGTYRWMPALPAVPGTELSGTVESVGAAVTKFRLGDRVLVSAREKDERGGCYVEFVTAAEDALFALPPSVDMEAAAALSNYQLVHLLMTDAARAEVGQFALVYAAAGGVGSALVDVSTGMGLKVIGVAKGADKAAFVKSMGAVRSIDRASEKTKDVILEVTGGRGVDVIFDPVGGPAFPDNIQLLAHLGKVISFGSLAGQPAGDLLAAMRAQRNKNPSVMTFSIHGYDKLRDRRRGAMTWAIDQLAAKKIRPAIHTRLPLTEARKAHELMESGRSLGKILLQPERGR